MQMFQLVYFTNYEQVNNFIKCLYVFETAKFANVFQVII